MTIQSTIIPNLIQFPHLNYLLIFSPLATAVNLSLEEKRPV